jgi:DNA polymerase III gamma/tau subunit
MQSFLAGRIDSHAESSPREKDGKVFIIDECHFLPGEAWDSIIRATSAAADSNSSSNSSSNNNNVFILITASIEQLPRAVVSRCHRFAFPKLGLEEIASRMEEISALEGIEIERGALQLIAARSDGSLREAAITLDQLRNFGQRITEQVIAELVSNLCSIDQIRNRP